MTNGRSPIFILDSTRRRGETISSQFTASSAAGTPLGTDRGGTQSPQRPRPNSGEARETQETDRTTGASDAALKAAANEMDSHRTQTNGNGFLSPSVKRKTPDDDDNDGDGDSQSQKRQRQD